LKILKNSARIKGELFLDDGPLGETEISIVECRTIEEPAVGGSESAERGVFLKLPDPLRSYCRASDVHPAGTLALDIVQGMNTKRIDFGRSPS
jgi:hypothetical protein